MTEWGATASFDCDIVVAAMRECLWDILKLDSHEPMAVQRVKDNI